MREENSFIPYPFPEEYQRKRYELWKKKNIHEIACATLPKSAKATYETTRRKIGWVFT